MRRFTLPAAAVLGCALSACGEETPTGTGEGLIPVSPTTIEVRLPWEQFASRLEVFGGFGVTSDARLGVLANGYRGLLDARTLARWPFIATSETVRDSAGTLVLDTLLQITGGAVVVHFDTLASRPEGSVTVSAHRTLTEWDPNTASWLLAVDSGGVSRPWPQAGGGPSDLVAMGVWDRTGGDSLVIELDSLAVRAWIDTAAVGRGVRLDAETEDVRLEVRALALRYRMIPSVHPDTLLERSVSPVGLTFIYTPQPGPPSGELRVGGIPAWRSVLHTHVPRTLDGPPALCAALGCPFEVTPERINHASLVLRTLPTVPAAFQPTDSVRVDVRPVLAPERLPKSPLGSPVAGLFGHSLSATLFQSPRQVSIPITDFVRAQVAPEPPSGAPAPTTLALLSLFEPASIAFANFVGPGQPGEPMLRLILTSSVPVQLP